VVYIVDDDVSFHTATRQRLQLAGYEVQVYSSAEQFLDQQRDDSRLGCLLVDASISGPNGPALQARLHEAGSALPVVFVSAQEDIKTVVQTIKAGAEDFLAKPVLKERLLEVIKRALLHFGETQEHDSQIVAMRALLSRLTPREHQVFELLARGKPHKQIAYALGTSERTVKLHRHNVMQKCQVRSLAELAVIAERLGLLPEGRGIERLRRREKQSTPTTSGTHS